MNKFFSLQIIIWPKQKNCILYDVDTLEFIDFLCCLVHGQFLRVSGLLQKNVYYPSSLSFSLYPGSYTPPFKFSWAIHLTRGSNNFPRSLSSPPWYTLQNLFAKFNPTLLFESCVISWFPRFWNFLISTIFKKLFSGFLLHIAKVMSTQCMYLIICKPWLSNLLHVTYIIK